MRMASSAPTNSRLRPTILAITILAASLSMLGCDGLGGSKSTAAASGPAASPVQHPMLENIPLPVGFQIVDDRSNAWKSGQIRWGNCEFEGGISPEKVRSFYVEYMPSAKFTLRQERLDGGEYHLRFESDSEECNVRIKRAKLKTSLVLTIGPLPKGTTERPVNRPTRQP